MLAAGSEGFSRKSGKGRRCGPLINDWISVLQLYF